MDKIEREDRMLLISEGDRVTKNLYAAVDEFVLYSAYTDELKRDTLIQMIDRLLPARSDEEMGKDMEKQVLELRAKAVMDSFSRISDEEKNEALKQIIRGGCDEKAK